MLIALCLYKYFPYGGLQRDFLAIAKILREQGHQIRIYTREWEGDRPNIANDLILVPTKALTNHGKDREFNKWVLNHIKQHPVDRVVGFNKMPGLDVYYGADVCYAEKIRQEKKGWLYRFTSRCRHYLEFEKSVLEKGATTKILIISKKQKTKANKVDLLVFRPAIERGEFVEEYILKRENLSIFLSKYPFDLYKSKKWDGLQHYMTQDVKIVCNCVDAL